MLQTAFFQADTFEELQNRVNAWFLVHPALHLKNTRIKYSTIEYDGVVYYSVMLVFVPDNVMGDRNGNVS